jgi:hypothetical protein
MSDSVDRGMPDFRQARHPSRVFRGSCDDGECVVTVFDSALPENKDNPRMLSAAASRRIADYAAGFAWGEVTPGALQLAIALLLDVGGDAEVARKWHERFASTFVSALPASWCVSELDIALCLYCFDNARPGS